MSGSLRWITWGNDSTSRWHLRFGPEGFPICDRVIPAAVHVKTRLLASGPPAGRCTACAEVIRLRLGLPEPRQEPKP